MDQALHCGHLEGPGVHGQAGTCVHVLIAHRNRRVNVKCMDKSAPFRANDGSKQP